jgi:hypothetical protein
MLSRKRRALADGHRRVTIVAVKDDRKALPLPTQVEEPSYRAISRGLFLARAGWTWHVYSMGVPAHEHRYPITVGLHML